jgi:hypothetical protein
MSHIEEFYISLIFYKAYHCLMNAKIFTKQTNDLAKISRSSPGNASLLIDKPNYVDGVRYKVEL